jgi:hypothetical protein
LFGILRDRSRVIKHQILRLSIGDLHLSYLNPTKPTLTIQILQFNFLLILDQDSIEEIRIVAIGHLFGLEVVKERVELLYELVLEGVQGHWMGVEVVRLHEVAEERQFWAYEALFLEGRVYHALAMTQEIYEFLVAGVFSLSAVVGILEGNIRKRDELPNPQSIVGLRSDFLQISTVF